MINWSKSAMAKHPTSKAKVFVDSSVLLAASLSSTGSAADIITYAETGEITLCLSQVVLDDVEVGKYHEYK